MRLVLDSSATRAWVYGDERTASIDYIFDRVAEFGAKVPNLWHLEVANSLTVAVRRQRISSAERSEALADLAQLDISVDDETVSHSWKATTQLADLHGLSVYDAAYLELAQRKRLPLVTLDVALLRAAKSAGVEVL